MSDRDKVDFWTNSPAYATSVCAHHFDDIDIQASIASFADGLGALAFTISPSTQLGSQLGSNRVALICPGFESSFHSRPAIGA